MALYDNLLEFKFRDISVPFESIETDGSQDNAEHKRVDVDGARQEGMGRNPYQFSGRIPFINGLFRGPQETWDPLKLFPETFLKFLGAMEDRSAGPLQHPAHGIINCVPGTWKYTFNSDARGGVFMDVSFKETIGDTSVDLGNTSALAGVQAAANDLTDQLAAISPTPDFSLKDDGFDDLEDFANQLSSVGDQVELLENKVVGKIDTVIAKVNKLADGIGKTASVIQSTTGDVASHTVPLGNSAARLVDNCNRLNFALVGLKTTLQKKDKTIAFFTTVADTTIGSLSSQLKSKVSDLVALNPLLVQSPVVPPQTVVRYYA